MNFFEIYSALRRLRNTLDHRYNMPKDEEFLLNLKNKLGYISELEQSIKELIK